MLFRTSLVTLGKEVTPGKSSERMTRSLIGPAHRPLRRRSSKKPIMGDPDALENMRVWHLPFCLVREFGCFAIPLSSLYSRYSVGRINTPIHLRTKKGRFRATPNSYHTRYLFELFITQCCQWIHTVQMGGVTLDVTLWC